MKKIFMTALSIATLCLFMGCREKGAFEKVGERADEIVDNAKDGDPLLHKKGTAEKAGEAIDDAVKDVTGDKH